MSITGSMQLAGLVEELERRVAALDAAKAELEAKLDKLTRDFMGLRMRAGRQKESD
jgi:hypothetical protein